MGFCAPKVAPSPNDCDGDADCGSRERCLCGRCTVQFCDSASGCGGALACDFRANRCAQKCSRDLPCPGRDSCRRGFCSGKCESDADCQAGELCSPTTLHCVVSACARDGECLVGQEVCAIQRIPANLHEPTLIAEASRALLFFESTPGSQTVIERAWSQDGREFDIEPETPVLSPAIGEHRVGSPSVVVHSSGYVMFFDVDEGAAIFRATSRDGLSWTRQPRPVLEASLPWEGGRVHSPAAVVTGSGLLLFYEGGDGAGIGVARSDDDGLSWTRVSADAVLARENVEDAVLWRAIDRVGKPFVMEEKDALGRDIIGLWFAALGVESASSSELGTTKPPRANFSIGYAAAIGPFDAETVPAFSTYPFNPVFDRALGFLEHLHESAPAVMPFAGQYLLFYEAFTGEGLGGTFGLAVNPQEDRF